MLKTPRRALHFGSLGGLALVAALVLLSSSGCFESGTETNTDSSSTSSATIPPLSEIQANLNLTTEQEAALKSAHARWQQAALAPAEGALPGSEPPMMEFIAESAAILDHEQLLQLITTLGQSRQDRFAGPGGGQHRGRGGPPGSGGGERPGPGGPGRHAGPGPGVDPFADLGLSDAQRAALEEAMQTLHTTLRSLHEQLAAGQLTQEQFEQAVEEARATHEATVVTILTAEQYAQLLQKRRDRMIEHLQTRLAGFDEQVARRVDLLDRILELDDQQVSDIRDMLMAAKSSLETIIARLQSGELSPEDARTALEQQREETETAMRAHLTAEQVAILDALKSLRPPGRGPHP